MKLAKQRKDRFLNSQLLLPFKQDQKEKALDLTSGKSSQVNDPLSHWPWMLSSQDSLEGSKLFGGRGEFNMILPGAGI